MKIIPLISPKIMDLQDKYVYLDNEVSNAEILLECRNVWCKMSKSKYENLLYSLICDAEKDVFTLRAELNDVINTMMKIGGQRGR